MLMSLTSYGQINITEQPKSQYTRLSGNVVMTVKAKGDGLRYRWYVKKGVKKKYVKVSYETSRRIVIRCDKTSMSGWKYKCRIKDKYGNIMWSNPAKITITDIGAKYTYQLDVSYIADLFMPKAADGYCYVYCYNKKYANQIKSAINIINQQIGKLFIYTPTAAIADIVVIGYDNNYVDNNIFLIGTDREFIEHEGYYAAAVAFNAGSYHYLIGINHSYVKNLTDAEIRGIIIHELGHCVGLEHSNNINDIMYAKNNGTDVLSKNDIKLFKRARKIVKNIDALNSTYTGDMVDVCYKK